MAVGTLLAPQPGERVLDLCAAPGGKSTHIAALLAGQGLLVSNEIDLKRAQVLQHNLDRWGARNIVVLNESPERLAKHWPGAFDRVLVDAPCSGEGMFRKNVEARYHWSEAHVRGCALRQRAILDSAAHLVRPGGILAYATCTFAPEENEGVIARFLQRFPDFVLEEPAWFPGFAPGHPEWSTWPSAQRHDDPEESGTGPSRPLEAGPGPSGQPAGPDTLARTVRLWPHRLEGEGHFIAIMRHTGAADRPAWPGAAADRLTSPQQACLAAFWREVMAMPLPNQLRLHQRGRDTIEVYARPPDGLDVSGLRALRPGWHLGTLRGGTRVRFEPAHGLAMALSCDTVQRRLDEPLGSEAVACYLRGEALRVPGPDGWLLICVEGFPLGWGKRSRGVIKNHYPKALRRLQ